MQVGALLNAPVANPPPGNAAPRVQPVNAIVRYPSSRSHDTRQSTYETALEGEFLRGAGHGQQRKTGADQILPGLLINAARAVSAYASVAASTNGARERRRLDLHA